MLYVVLGTSWIVFTDLVGPRLFAEQHLPWLYDWATEISFLLATGIVLFFGSRKILQHRSRSIEALIESEHRFQQLYDKAPLGYQSLAEDGTVLKANETLLDHLGYRPEEFIGHWFGDFVIPEQKELFRARFEQFRREGEVRGARFHMVRKDGGTVIVEAFGRFLPGRNSDTPFTQCILLDITEQESAHRAIEESEARYRTLFETANDGIFLIRDEVFVDCNVRALEMFGGEREDVIGRTPYELSPEFQSNGRASEDYGAELFERVYSGAPQVFEWTHRRVDGTDFHTEVSLNRVGTENNSSLIFAVIRDLSERFAAEKALREAQDRFRLAFQTSPDAVNINRLSDGLYVDVNEGFCRIMGYSRGEVVGKSSLELNIWDNPADRDRLVRGLRANGEVSNLEARFLKKSGEVVIGLMSARVIELEGIPHTINVTRDISDFRRAEEALRESDNKYRLLVDHSLDGIYLIQNRRIAFCNRKFAEILGYTSPDELIDQKIETLIARKDIDRYLENLANHEWGRNASHRIDLHGVQKNGDEIEIEAYESKVYFEGQPGVQGMMRDVTEQRSLQRQLEQAARLESVGRLAGGVAHDFNNLLTAIIANAEMGLLQTEEADPLVPSLQDIISIAERGSHLTQKLLSFSKQQPNAPRVLKLDRVLHDLERMLNRLLGEDIDMQLEVPEGIWHVEIDPGSLEQVIVNLAVNARDAMPGGGTLRLALKNTEQVDGQCVFHAEPFKGDFVHLAISDTGIGIAKEMMAKIFDPFFSTKPVGKGTGLGLSLVYGILNSAGGHLQVESTVGEGTTFHIFLPRSDKILLDDVQSASELSNLAGSETILLVEDDQSVRNTLAQLLKNSGYNVQTAISGNEAIDLLQGGRITPDLIVSDIIMPSMSGPEAMLQMQHIVPPERVLYISGYTEAPEKLESESGSPILKKPFRSERLLSMVRNMLDRNGDS